MHNDGKIMYYYNGNNRGTINLDKRTQVLRKSETAFDIIVNDRTYHLFSK